MAIIFTFGLLLYYWLVLRRHSKSGSTLAALLWFLYLALGLSGVFIEITDGIKPVFEPNYLAVLLLLACIMLSISGFLRFRTQNIRQIFGVIRGQRIIEFLLIASQLCAMIYFLPFAISSLAGDVNQNRLLLDEKMEIFASYGLLNTAAGAASQLFSSSLVLAFIRLASKENQGRSVFRALLLVFSSLSFVVYILAYVGRDGVVYWLMTAAMIFMVFRGHLAPADRKKITLLGFFGAIILLIPFGIITISRFFDLTQDGGWSPFEYFGAQIHNFSDYSSMERPLTFGLSSFPMFFNAGCTVLGLTCPSWLDIKESIFPLYLSQDKEPWLFGTFVSDLAGDFGSWGALLLIFAFSVLCNYVITGWRFVHSLSLSRLLLVFFLFLIPYWGVFYFRFSISNVYIIVNIAFIGFVAILHRLLLLSSKISNPSDNGVGNV